MTNGAEPATPPATRAFFGNALIAIGWLIVALAGLCTSAVVVLGLSTQLRSSRPAIGDLLALSLLPLGIGGIPIAIGAAMIAAGRRAKRKGVAASQQSPTGPGA